MPKRPRKPKHDPTDDWSARLEVTSVETSAALQVCYAIWDETERVVEKGVLTIWCAWDDRRSMGVVFANRLAHAAAECFETRRFEVTGKREEFDAVEFARKMMNTRALYLRTLVQEGPPTAYLPKDEAPPTDEPLPRTGEQP